MTTAPYVAAIIVNEEGKVLVQHHNKTKTVLLVSGKMENQETPMEALKRELREETGVTEFSVFGNYTFYDENCKVNCHTFYVEILNGIPVNLEKHKHKWQDYKSRKEIAEYDLPAATCLELALSRNDHIK